MWSQIGMGASGEKVGVQIYGEGPRTTLLLGMAFCDLECISSITESSQVVSVLFGSVSCPFISLLIGHVLCLLRTHGEQANQVLGLAFYCRQSTLPQ